MKSFGGGFVKIVLVFLLLVGVVVASEPLVIIKTTPEVEKAIKNISPEERKLVEKAIKVGDEFVTLYYTGQAGYDIEIDEKWNRTFNPLAIVNGKSWNDIQDNVNCISKIFSLLGCSKLYLSFVAISKESILLSYQSKVIGGNFNKYSQLYVNNKQFFQEFQGNFFVINLSINKALKIAKIDFPNKIAARHYQTEINFIVNELNSANKKDKNVYKNTMNSIISASSICKDY